MHPNDLRGTDSSESEPVSRRSTVLALLAPARPLAVRERLLVQGVSKLLQLLAMSMPGINRGFCLQR